jgi:hypothetical protein
MEQRIARDEDSRELSRQVQPTHVADKPLHLDTRRGCFGSSGVEHRSREVHANDLASLECNRYGQAPRSTAQLEHPALGLSRRLQIEPLRSCEPPCPFISDGEGPAGVRKQQVVKLRFGVERALIHAGRTPRDLMAARCEPPGGEASLAAEVRQKSGSSDSGLGSGESGTVLRGIPKPCPHPLAFPCRCGIKV